MSSPEKLFEELLKRLEVGTALRPTGQDPIFYLVYPAGDSLEMKRHLASLQLPKLKKSGWAPTVVSIARVVLDALRAYGERDTWLDTEAQMGAMDPETIAQMSQSIAGVLDSEKIVEKAIEKALATAAKAPKGMVILTDLEGLHPYLRIGVLEQAFAGKVSVPLIILYPGKRDGTYHLKFLDFYRSDGNYRSQIIDGVRTC